MITALFITVAIVSMGGQQAGSQAVVYRDNHLVLSLSLSKNQKTQVEGKLGPVTIEVKGGKIRIREYASLRMIATRSGWIQATGSILTCVPCGIFIKIDRQVDGRVDGQIDEQVDGKVDGKNRNSSVNFHLDGIAR